MSSKADHSTLATLPKNIRDGLENFLAAAQQALGPDLHSTVLFGSAAEGRLRPASDVNLILVLARFDAGRITALQPALAFAHAAIRLNVMLLLRDEIPAAAECFAQKFADIERRRVVLSGDDPFAQIAVPDAAKRLRTRQVLLNLTLRLRERYAQAGPLPDQILASIQDVVGPIRTCAAAILELEGTAAASPKDALARIVDSLRNPEWNYLPEYLSGLREGKPAELPPPAEVIVHLHNVTQAMRARLEA